MTQAPVVLVVEDQPQIARAVARQLQDAFNVVLAKNAAEALDLAEQRPDIAAVVSDWLLGDGGSGMDVLDWFRRKRPDVPRVLLSAQVPQDLGPQIVAGSVQRYVAKPPAPEELLRTLKEMLRTPVGGS